MKRFRVLLLLVLVMSLIFVSCKNEKTDDDKAKESTTESTTEEKNTEENKQTEDDKVMSSDSEDDKDSESEKVEDDEEAEEEEDEAEGELDMSLMDKALLSSVKIKIPDTIYSEATITDITTLNDTPVETISTEITYQKGDNLRTETITEEGTDVVIYVAEEKTEYDYTVGDADGYKYEDAEDMYETELMKSYEGKSLLEFFETEMNLDIDLEFLASRDKVAGRKAIFIEMVPVEEPAEGEEFEYRVWIDQEFMHVLKFELKLGEWINSTHEVTKVEYNKEVDDDLFIPPSDVNFD